MTKDQSWKGPGSPSNMNVKITESGHDPVKHPKHYTSHPSGVECITITEHMNFCLGNSIKYIWRAGLKSKDPIQDLEKAKFYLDQEIARLKKLDQEYIKGVS